MAQLSADSFAPGGDLKRLDVALDELAARLAPVTGVEHVASGDALARVLARDVRAPIDVPGFDNSAVDGYAVRFADLATGPTRLPVSMRVPAGALDVGALPPGTAARIFTGAPMPEGTDSVFMQEDVTAEGSEVFLPAGLKHGANRRFAGEDFASGDLVLAAGVRLGPHHVAALAAMGLADVPVRRRLRVGVFSTGDEITESRHGVTLRHGAQFDANRPMLIAFLRMRGMEPVDLGILPDRRAAIVEALERAARDCDALLTSGGVSTGEEDHVKAAVEEAGRLDFWRLAIKPGRPIAMGRIGGTAFLGLPGNPAAAAVTFLRFVGPVLDMLAGAGPCRPVAIPVRSAFSHAKKSGRLEYVRVSLTKVEGGVVATRYLKDGAGLISSLIASDGLAEIAEDITRIDPGDAIRFLPYGMLIA